MQTIDVLVPDRVVKSLQQRVKWTLVQWLVSRGDKLYRGQQLAELRCNSTRAIAHLTSPRPGTLQSILIPSGEIACQHQQQSSNITAAVIEYCPHSVTFRGLCALCGIDVELATNHFAESPISVYNANKNKIAVGHNDQFALSVTRNVAESISTSTSETLLGNNKLALVLDLDHTIVHATHDIRSSSMLDNAPSNANLKSVISFPLPSTTNNNLTTTNFHSPPPMRVKLRPHLSEFLTRVSKIFQLHIYTMGSRLYADQVANIIDPDKSLFHGRVTCREDFAEGAFNRKNIQRIFPCDDSLAVIVDDREDVWISPQDGRTFMPNLIKADPYHFWTGLDEIYDYKSPINVPLVTTLSDTNQLKQQSDQEQPENTDNSSHRDDAHVQELRKRAKEMWDKDKDPHISGHLLRLTEILEQCHRLYFRKVKLRDSKKGSKQPKGLKSPFIDVKDVISEMRSQVLNGCTITFSGVIPLHASPENSAFWSLATRLGAVCIPSFTKGKTTHMVMPDMRRMNTVKYEEAENSGCTFVVTTRWLLMCEIEFQRCAEFDYRVPRDNLTSAEADDEENSEERNGTNETKEQYKLRIERNFEQARSALPSPKRRAEESQLEQDERSSKKRKHDDSTLSSKEETEDSEGHEEDKWVNGNGNGLHDGVNHDGEDNGNIPVNDGKIEVREYVNGDEVVGDRELELALEEDWEDEAEDGAG